MMRTRDGDPYDISTWGPECARGIRYASGAYVEASGKGAIHKMSKGRKHRGKASDSIDQAKLEIESEAGEPAS